MPNGGPNGLLVPGCNSTTDMRRFFYASLLRLRVGSSWGTRVFLGLFGACGTIIGVASATGASVSLSIPLACLAICVASGIITAYVAGRLAPLPKQFAEEFCSDGPYQCTPLTQTDLREVTEWTRPYFRHEFVSAERVEQWRARNPSALAGITNAQGELCASFGIIALDDAFMDFYIEGKLQDTQIEGKNVCTQEETKKSKRLYISGVIVRDAERHIGRKRAFVLVWSILVYLERTFGLDVSRQLYALAVTRVSETLMKNLGFKLVTPAGQRIDKCNLYRMTLTRESWNRVLASIGDFSAMCECTF